ncbi:hypothetical protein FRX31_031603 [Thalictrum thalictroides]|uniref:Uncharacterized protein n=1 Tax=Thalictrum thalictroides TaxID=46969 RepID=A0A7J6V1V6_THATH|nr:hypothetical protein FRX31_031603 [Thalictrum thalictroides]
MIHTEGRHLKIKKRTACVKCSSSNTVKGTKESDGQKTSDLHHKIPMDGFVEAFRPTTPGHSPDRALSTIKNSFFIPAKLPNSPLDLIGSPHMPVPLSQHLIYSRELFAAEGRHLKSRKNREYKKFTRYGDNTLTVTRNHEHTSDLHHDNSSMVQHAEEFRPTTPGHSPGIGHYLKN